MRPTRSFCSLSAEFLLVKETILIQNERITQLYVIQSEKDPFVWFGVLFVDSGIYSSAVIRFVVLIRETYPDCPCPKVLFEPIPFHPLIDPTTGELDTRNAFPDWSGNTHKLHQLLLFVKRVIYDAEIYIKEIQDLIRHNLLSRSIQDDVSTTQPLADSDPGDQEKEISTDPINLYGPELIDVFENFDHTLGCIKMFELDQSEFRRRVEDYKSTCHQLIFDSPNIYGNDRNALLFKPWDENVHEPVRSCIIEGRFAPSNLLATYHKETDSVAFIPGSDSA